MRMVMSLCVERRPLKRWNSWKRKFWIILGWFFQKIVDLSRTLIFRFKSNPVTFSPEEKHMYNNYFIANHRSTTCTSSTRVWNIEIKVYIWLLDGERERACQISPEKVGAWDEIYVYIYNEFNPKNNLKDNLNREKVWNPRIHTKNWTQTWNIQHQRPERDIAKIK
jgi:hypothetical protein